MSGAPLVRHPAIISLVLAGSICLAVGAVVFSGGLEPVELMGYDWLIFARGDAQPSPELVFVDFDNDTVKALGTYPIPRGTLGRALEKIAAGEPDLIGLDWILSERRPCCAAEDHELASVMGRIHEQSNNLILVDNFESKQLLAGEPLPEFKQHALEVASINMPQEKDGFTRRMYLAIVKEGYKRRSLPIALATYRLGPERVRPCGPLRFCIDNKAVPLDGSGFSQSLIGSWSLQPATLLPARAVLAPAFDARILKGKIVLVGQSNSAANDLHETPLSRFRRVGGTRLSPGTQIQAAALATLLRGDTISVLGKVPLWLINFAFIWAVVVLILAFRPAYSLPAVVGAALCAYLLAQSMFTNLHAWMRFVSTETGMALAAPAGLGYRFLEERRLKALAEAERKQVMGLFERYVSPEVAAEIWTRFRRNEIVLQGEERTATVLFSDIRSFTKRTAGIPSAQVLSWLNHYLTAMSDVIKENGGFLNKFIGDGIMVLFGVPLSEGMEQDACRAVRTALQMMERVEHFDARLGPDDPPLKIGVGIHTGPLTAGNVGACDRLEYSVIGETVNLASRLESLTKELHAPIVISHTTRELVKNKFETVPLGEIEVRGFAEKIILYAVPVKTAFEVKT